MLRAASCSQQSLQLGVSVPGRVSGLYTIASTTLEVMAIMDPLLITCSLPHCILCVHTSTRGNDEPWKKLGTQNSNGGDSNRDDFTLSDFCAYLHYFTFLQ